MLLIGVQWLALKFVRLASQFAKLLGLDNMASVTSAGSNNDNKKRCCNSDKMSVPSPHENDPWVEVEGGKKVDGEHVEDIAR